MMIYDVYDKHMGEQRGIVDLHHTIKGYITLNLNEYHWKW